MADREQVTCYICEGKSITAEQDSGGGFFLHNRYICPRCEKVIVTLKPDCREYGWLMGQIKNALVG